VLLRLQILILFIAALLLPQLLHADPDIGPKLFKNSLDMTITHMDYKRPESGVGFAGKAVFSKMVMFKDDMTMSLDNSESIFDSQIFIRKNFVGFKGGFTNIGFSLDEDHTLGMIKNGSINESRLNMNAKRIHMSANMMKIQLNHVHLGLDRFRLYCKKHLDYSDISSEAFIAACFNNATLNALKEGEASPAKVKFYKQGTLEEKVLIDTKLNSLEVVDDQILIKGGISQIDIIGLYLINTGKYSLQCNKKREILEFSSEELIANCQSGVNIDTDQMNISNRVSGTSFIINPKTIQIRDEQLTLVTPRLEVIDRQERTILHNMRMNCFKSRETDPLELDNVISECLSYSKITVDKIDTSGSNKSTELAEIDGQDTYELLESAGFGTKRKGSSSAKVKNLILSVENSRLRLSAKVHFLFKHFKVKLEAKLQYEKEDDVIQLELTKAKLPFGISSKKILLFLIKKFMVSENLTIVDGIVNIAL
jgi:hypothetical protein